MKFIAPVSLLGCRDQNGNEVCWFEARMDEEVTSLSMMSSGPPEANDEAIDAADLDTEWTLGSDIGNLVIWLRRRRTQKGDFSLHWLQAYSHGSLVHFPAVNLWCTTSIEVHSLALLDHHESFLPSNSGPFVSRR